MHGYREPVRQRPGLTTDFRDDSRDIIGVAISHQQAKLTSPETPAIEKAQALQNNGGFFEDIATQDDDSTAQEQSLLHDALPARQRASSGPAVSFDSAQDSRYHATEHSSQSSSQLHTLSEDDKSLRRAASDESFRLNRALSQVSSLGDDSRFTGIHAQVSSRFKAIRDTLQESNLIKIPSLSSIRLELFGSEGRTDPITRNPYHSVREAALDLNEGAAPDLSTALARLKGDIVVLGGYRGSVLRSAATNKQLWVPIKVGLNLRKVDLEVGIAPEDDLKSADDIIPDSMLSHIGPVDISKRLFKKLRSCEAHQSGRLRVHDYGYDWRLDPLFLSQQLCQFLEQLSCNKSSPRIGATVIAHSLGGLITRHAVNAKPDLFRGVVYAGVPTRCVNILGPLRNGDDVLLSSRVLTAQVNFTIRTSFALLPLDGRCFVDKYTHEEYPVDFFNPKTWLDYRLSPCIARPLVANKPQNGIISSVAKAIPAAARRISISIGKPDTSAGGVAEPDTATGTANAYRQPANPLPDQVVEPTVSTAVSLPWDEAYDYLTRMLARVKRFKQELDFRAELAEHNRYPPVAVIYGKNIPTVTGAKVDGIDGIKRADAYDDLAFGSGDGVVLARAAMLPPGYTAARGGIISSERGHVSLLGDLEAVGRALNSIISAKEDGIGVAFPSSGHVD